MTEWDPVSKQPVFKNAAVSVEKISDATGPAPAPTTTASRPAAAAGPRSIRPTAGGKDAEATERVGGSPPRFPDAVRRGPQGGTP